MNIRPKGTRVLLEIDETDHTFAGGELIIARVPDSMNEYPLFPQRGKVIAIGNRVRDIDVGDYVVCTKHNGVRLPKRQWGGRNLMLGKEEFVLLKILEPKEVQYGESHSEVWRYERRGRARR